MPFFERFRRKPDPRPSINFTSAQSRGEIQKTHEANPYELQQGRVYRSVGGKEEDMLTQCPNCGAPYKGPRQQSCPSCQMQRKVFLFDVTDRPYDQLGKVRVGTEAVTLDLPRFGGRNITAEDSTQRKRIIGNQVKLGESCEVTLVGGNTVSVGDSCEIDALVGTEISAGEFYQGKALVGRDITVGDSSEIDLVVVASGGHATFGEYVQVKNLVLGQDASADFGESSEVNQLRHIGVPDVQGDEYFELKREDFIDPDEFTGVVQGVLNRYNPQFFSS